jgi:hypothetical protein
MDGYRRAALTLHGLSEADRGWMLKQLPAPDQARLGGLLGELRALGMPADPALLAGLAERSAAPVSASAKLRAAPAQRVHAVLAHEPAALIAALLAIEAWPWREAVLEALPPLREADRVSPNVAPQLAAALVSCMEARLEAAADIADERAPAAPPHRVLQAARRALSALAARR